MAVTTFKQQCPSCEAMISIKEGMVGKKVECTKCKDKFIAERPEEDEEDEKVSAKKDTKALSKKNIAVTSKAPSAGKRSKLEVEEEEEEDEKPRKGKADTNGKSNGKPTAKPSKRDEDDGKDVKKSKTDKTGAGSNKLMIGLGLAVVGVLILAVAAFFVPSGGQPQNPIGAKGGGPVGIGDTDKDKEEKKIQPPTDGDPKTPEKTSPLTDAEIARMTNLLPGDCEHVFHIFFKDVFAANSTLREAAFATPGALDPLAAVPLLGFSMLGIDDIIVAEKYTSPGWKYTVIHFSDALREDQLKAALRLESVKLAGQTCYKTTKGKTNPYFDQLARFSFGVPNHLRFYEARRDKESFLRVYNSQTLIIGDEAPVTAFMAAKEQFPLQSTKEASKGAMNVGSPDLMPIAETQSRAYEFVSFHQVVDPIGPKVPPGFDPKNPKFDPKKGPPGFEDKSGPKDKVDPKDPMDPKIDPKPNPIPGGSRDDTYLTIKPSLKVILDRMEFRGPDGKNKVMFSSATDMKANQVEANLPNTVMRRPRQLWDVTLLLFERKPRIMSLGTSLVQRDMLKYQLRNELTCTQEVDAKEFQAEMVENTSYKVAKFIQSLTKHEVRLPTAEKKDAAVVPEQKPDGKKTSEGTSSQITVNQKFSTVEFVLDLVLDNPTLGHVQDIAAVHATSMRMEMEAASSLSLRHAVANGGKTLGQRGLTARDVAPGRFPPGAFRRDYDLNDKSKRPSLTDREPRNRISWMAGLLPHLGHEDLFKKIQFNQSWRDPGNWSAGNTVVPQFLDPRYPDYTRQLAIGDLPLDFAATHYVGIAGVGMDAASYKRGDPATEYKRGVFSYDESATLNEIQEGRGLSNTILMIQVPHDPKNGTGVSPWIAGGGGTVRGVPEKNAIAPFVLTTDRNGKTITHDNKRGTFVVMTDGTVRFIDQNISDEVFKAMCTVKGPTPKDFDLTKDPNTPLIPAPQVNGKGPAKKPAEKPPTPKTEPEKKPLEPNETPKSVNQEGPKTSRWAPPDHTTELISFHIGKPHHEPSDWRGLPANG